MIRQSIALNLLGAVVVVLCSAAVEAQSCNCEISPRKEKAYDVLLELDSEEQANAEALHAPWGVPNPPSNATNERLLHQEHYLTGYDDDLKIPLWVTYRLSASDASVTRHRLNCFRRDHRLAASDAAVCADYVEPIFDRGHLAPRADFNRTEPAMINTFMFTNMVPQHDQFNQRI